MAGEWVAIDCNLATKPEVLEIMAATGCRQDEAVGRLVMAWAWLQLNAVDGVVRGSPSTLAAVAGGDAEFWGAVEAVGWLAFLPDRTVEVAGWSERFTQAAKERLRDRRRSQGRRAAPATPRISAENPTCPDSVRSRPDKNRTRSGRNPDENRTRAGLEEKRREEKREETSTTTAHASVREPEGGQPAGPPHGPATPQIEDGWTAGLDLWTGLREAWNGSPWVQRWDGFDFPRGDLLAARLADPDWVRRWPDALARLERCRFFEHPVSLLQFLKPEFVGNVLAGAYDHRRGRNGKPIVESDALPW